MVRLDQCSWTGGLLISKTHVQKITLDLDTYYRLKELVGELDQAVQLKRVPISADGTVQGCWTTFEGRPYLNIRKWTADGKQSIYGVSLREDEWSVLKSFLSDSVEMKLVKKAYAVSLREKAWNHLKTSCVGCKIDHPSQTQHPCLTSSTSEAVDSYLADHTWKIQTPEVILKAAQEAMKKGYCLKSPLDHVTVIESLLRQEIVELASQE